MQFQRRQIVLGAAALALAPQAARAQTRLPFTLLNGKMFVAVEVNGQPAQAMVDSGAQFSAVSLAFAAQHGVKLGGRIGFRGIQGAGSARRIQGVTIKAAAGVQITGDLVALDLENLAGVIEHDIDAVIGGDLFQLYVVDIDFDAQTLAFIDRQSFRPPADARPVALQPFKGLMTAQVKVEGGAPIRALVDLGSNSPLIVSPGPARTLGLLDGRRVSKRLLGGHGPSSAANVTTARTIEVGGEIFKDVPILIPPKPVAADANLGLTLLWRFRLYLDYGGQRLWLGKAGADRHDAFQRDYVGLETRYAGDTLKVTFVSPGSPAETAGFKIGEVITAINGSPPRDVNMGLGLSEQPGQTLTLTLSTGVQRKVTLAVYY